jgi:kinetochore protein Spc25
MTCAFFLTSKRYAISKFDISFTMPHNRTIPIDLASILAEPTPTVELRLHAYEVSTSNFLRAVTNYANRAVAEITKHRNAQKADKKRLSDKTTAVKAETNQCKVKEIDLLAGTSSYCRDAYA